MCNEISKKENFWEFLPDIYYLFYIFIFYFINIVLKQNFPFLNTLVPSSF